MSVPECIECAVRALALARVHLEEALKRGGREGKRKIRLAIGDLSHAEDDHLTNGYRDLASQVRSFRKRVEPCLYSPEDPAQCLPTGILEDLDELTDRVEQASPVTQVIEALEGDGGLMGLREEELADRVVEHLSRCFGVEKPRVMFKTPREMPFLVNHLGAYDHEGKTLYLRRGDASVKTIGHEFHHHLTHLRGKESEEDAAETFAKRLPGAKTCGEIRGLAGLDGGEKEKSLITEGRSNIGGSSMSLSEFAQGPLKPVADFFKMDPAKFSTIFVNEAAATVADGFMDLVLTPLGGKIGKLIVGVIGLAAGAGGYLTGRAQEDAYEILSHFLGEVADPMPEDFIAALTQATLLGQRIGAGDLPGAVATLVKSPEDITKTLQNLATVLTGVAIPIPGAPTPPTPPAKPKGIVPAGPARPPRRRYFPKF